ncbi:hypothetical protein [Pyrococcus kukulkanii]|nr:hypothetical protein [Pyrococcus kukulkanii]
MSDKLISAQILHIYRREHGIVHLDSFSMGESMQYLSEGFAEVGMSVQKK